MKKSFTIFPAGLLLLFLFTATSTVLASGTASLPWWVVSNGGSIAGGTSLTINGTLGQPVVGLSGSDNISLSAGFWQGMPDENDGQYDIFLPLLEK